MGDYPLFTSYFSASTNIIMSKPGGKRGKSGDAKSFPAGGGKWDLALTSAVFDEDSWTPSVTWLVGKQIEDQKHIDVLNAIVQSGTRKLFSVVTKDSLYSDVCDLGNPKAKKAKEIPANSEVCEACKPYLDAGEQIPPPLLAKLIKWKLMSIKANDVKRRDTEAKAGSDKKKGKDDKGKERAKSPKKGGKKTPEPQQAKEGSKLRKRGDDDSDSKYIDDEPDDGASHYFLISGFHNPQVFPYLEEVGVSVSSVIGVASQDYDKLRRPPTEADNAEVQDTEKLKEEELRKDLAVFWRDLLPLVQRLPDSSSLHDMARLDYEVKSMMIPSDTAEEQKVQFASGLFEDIAVMIYDLLDARRLYKTFLDNLNLMRVPVYGQEETGDTEGRTKESKGKKC